MKKRVVITGMGVVSPNGIGNEAFCRAILAGTSGVQHVRSFDASDLPVQIAGEVQDFDELAWVDAHERKHVSRAVPLALAASTEALREAGIETTQLSLEQQREIGVLLGSGGGAQEFSEEQVRLWLHGQGEAGQPVLHSQRHHGHALQRDQHALRSARHEPRHHHRLHVVDRRVRLRAAANPVWLSAHDAGGRRGRADRAGNHEGLHPDEDHDGLVEPCSGARLAALLGRSRRLRGRRGRVDVLSGGVRTCPRARSEILAEVAGYGSTCEAFHRVRLQECGEEPARAIQMAMEDAGIAAADVDYVNLHGTSTQLNDRIETRALKLALGDKAYATPMSSLKSQIGHPQGACGAAGIAATLVAMQHGRFRRPSTWRSPIRIATSITSRNGTARRDRTCGVQLHCVWLEEFGAGAAQISLSPKTVVTCYKTLYLSSPAHPDGRGDPGFGSIHRKSRLRNLFHPAPPLSRLYVFTRLFTITQGTWRESRKKMY